MDIVLNTLVSSALLLSPEVNNSRWPPIAGRVLVLLSAVSDDDDRQGRRRRGIVAWRQTADRRPYSHDLPCPTLPDRIIPSPRVPGQPHQRITIESIVDAVCQCDVAEISPARSPARCLLTSNNTRTIDTSRQSLTRHLQSSLERSRPDVTVCQCYLT